MKKIFIFLLIFQAGYSDSTAQINEVKLKFVGNEKGYNDSSNGIISAYLKIDTSQYKTNEGLKFSIRLKNASKDTAKIRNILDLLTLSLTTKNGINVIYSHKRDLHLRTEPIEFKSLIIRYITINGEPVPIEVNKVEDLKIPASGNCEFFFSVVKSIKPDAVKPYDFAKAITLPEGVYRFFLTITILQKASFEILNTDPLSISYQTCK